MALILAAASSASHHASVVDRDHIGSIRANLDGDPRLERIVVRGTFGIGQRLVLEDVCRGRRVTYRLSRIRQAVDRLAVRELDGRRSRPEFFFDMRDGAGGHIGVAKVMRHTRQPDRGCPRPHTLFRYSTDRPRFRPPDGYGVTDFRFSFRNFASKYRGKEMRLWEGYVDASDALCCPSRQRVTFLRYAPRLDRYVPYRTRVSRVTSN